ncbi:methyltransferase-domain-containing protein [Coniella lustricola]|uniref:Ribosomal RNA-processing protein 8 n=1 Tax=Coniella lustricola TaxID=2025994 RepID=A0A2T3AKN3_9PEZI|nr:methyltransferase-domain-containing protein [Coniella lustricola]
MFAVKGWSVAADKLKPEVASAVPEASSAPKKSKKRKRPAAENVTSSNVADYWESVIEHKEAKSANTKAQQGGPQAKKAKKEKKLDSSAAPKDTTTDSAADAAVKPAKSDEKASKKDKKKAGKPEKKHKGASTSETAAVSQPQPPPPAAKLTPLQASMREKLISARFRHLNETLYTRPSAEALSLFTGAPEMFTEYHEGFRRQVEVWPENPVEGYLRDIRARARARHPPRDNKKSRDETQQQPSSATALQPLPRNRTTNLCTIADLGCGDARLATELQADKSKLRLDVLSFDLYSPSPLVTKADIANLPLANGSVDIAIFCLALMGTNWIDFIEEAYRVLRWKGELWIAEIKSRFSGAANGKKGVVEHSVGNRRKAAANKKASGGKAEAGAADEKTLLVEVDGLEDNRQQTDVTAFVDVLNKRGFMLVGQDQGHGADAVDLSNKMFVKMRFMKSAPATKGKCVRKEVENDRSKLGGKMPTMAKKPKFIDAADTVDEAGVLKPCVYKIR